VLKCFSPLLNSMKVFGLYFTQASRRIHDTSTPTSRTMDFLVQRKWNGGRIYATFILMVIWLHAARMLSVFHKTDRFGSALLLKLASISAVWLGALQYTACFIASHTGNLDRVFSDATLSKSDVARYRRLAIIHTIVCWVFMLADVSVYMLPLFIEDHALYSSLTPFGVHVFITDNLLILAKVMLVLLFILADSALFFSHSINYMVTSVLSDQFRTQNKAFHHAVGCRGKFQGSVREFRRRHQELSQSVQNADKFMMVNNVAGFLCQIVNVILIAYCSIFFRNETVGKDATSAIINVCWLVTTFFGLTLTAYQGIAINHEVCDAKFWCIQ